MSAAHTLSSTSEMLAAFASLQPGQSLDGQLPEAPAALQAALLAQWPGQVDCQLSRADDGGWHLRLTRLRPAGGCCGCCGG